MPIYKIYDEHLVSVIFEVEASSKEEARSKFMEEDRDIHQEIVYVGKTDYDPTGNITIVMNEKGGEQWTEAKQGFKKSYRDIKVKKE